MHLCLRYRAASPCEEPRAPRTHLPRTSRPAKLLVSFRRAQRWRIYVLVEMMSSTLCVPREIFLQKLSACRRAHPLRCRCTSISCGVANHRHIAKLACGDQSRQGEHNRVELLEVPEAREVKTDGTGWRSLSALTL